MIRGLGSFRPAIGLATAALALAACGDGAPPGPPPGGPAVGYARILMEDSARPRWDGPGPRPLVTSIWYPAAPGSRMEMVQIPTDRPVFQGGYAARDAEPAAEGRRPLVLLSHGTGGSGLQMMWLGRRLAEAGYVVAAPDHHGNTAAEARFDARGFRMPWERTRDLSSVLDGLLQHPFWGPRIDPRRVGAAGFSLGGYSVLGLAGARTDLDRLDGFCSGPDRDATCEPQAEYPEAEQDFRAMLVQDTSLERRLSEHRRDFTDPRIRTVVVLAPAPIQAFTEASLADLTSPLLVIVGRADGVAPAPTNARRLADRVPGARYEPMEGVGHYDFLNPCTSRGRRFVPVCRTSAPGGRSRLHDRVAALVLAHLGATL